jgi:hypothetical protein
LAADIFYKIEQKDFVMTRLNLKISALLLALLHVGNSQASLISYDLLTPDTSTDINYTNNFSNAFNSSQDGFQIYQQGVDLNIPLALLDQSTVNASDSLGIVKSANNKPFFGIVDTVNPDNPTNDAIASWKINIANLSAITFLTDIAAMGDFESNDRFEWRYSIDNNPFISLFKGVTNESTFQDYNLDVGNSITLSDPLTVNSIRLNNEFSTFTSSILATGNLLTLELNAKTNGGREVLAFQNVAIQAQTMAVSVSEPKTGVIFILALLFLLAKGFPSQQLHAQRIKLF